MAEMGKQVFGLNLVARFSNVSTGMSDRLKEELNQIHIGMLKSEVRRRTQYFGSCRVLRLVTSN